MAILTQGVEDLSVESTIDLSAPPLCFFLDSGESRQFESLPDQFLDGDINDVGEILFRVSCFSNRFAQSELSAQIKGLHPLMGANDGDMPSSRSRLVVVAQSGHHKKSLRVGDVLDDHQRHITDLKEIAEPLEGFQQNEKSQAGHFAARATRLASATSSLVGV